jgi:ABC-type multidrug transport system fused ATPase/permease subunit
MATGARAAGAPAQGIRLQNVSFKYPGAHRPAIEDLSLTARSGELACLMGPTGAGKSTAIDLILGLLRPDCGDVLIDDAPLLAQDLRAWRTMIGYVPQAISLMDDTIACNIALGLSEDKIDFERLHAAARRADIHEFIIDELEAGYDTRVGERGLRLSGGQRQRIGIARALYHDSSVLVLDEATNALDQETEQRVLNGLLELRPQRTIIFVSHRASVARRADRILVLARGRLVAQGTYEELTASDSHFRGLLVAT